MPIQHQTSFHLIVHQTDAGIVQQRASDGYINATELCKAAGKLWADYHRNKTTREFLEELSEDMGIPITLLIQTVRDGVRGIQGTWIHPQVAIHFGQWLSPKFAVRVSKWVHDWLSGKGGPRDPAPLPTHLARYLANDHKVPPGYFSVLQETGLNLFGPLHNVGFDIPKGWVPDISVGKCFCAWLRKERGIDTDALPEYLHDYRDGRQPVKAKLYPDGMLADFRNWFRRVWLPTYGVKYFKKKAVGSLAYLDRLPALAAPGGAAPIPPKKRKKIA